MITIFIRKAFYEKHLTILAASQKHAVSRECRWVSEDNNTTLMFTILNCKEKPKPASLANPAVTIAWVNDKNEHLFLGRFSCRLTDKRAHILYSERLLEKYKQHAQYRNFILYNCEKTEKNYEISVWMPHNTLGRAHAFIITWPHRLTNPWELQYTHTTWDAENPESRHHLILEPLDLYAPTDTASAVSVKSSKNAKVPHPLIQSQATYAEGFPDSFRVEDASKSTHKYLYWTHRNHPNIIMRFCVLNNTTLRTA